MDTAFRLVEVVHPFTCERDSVASAQVDVTRYCLHRLEWWLTGGLQATVWGDYERGIYRQCWLGELYA